MKKKAPQIKATNKTASGGFPPDWVKVILWHMVWSTVIILGFRLGFFIEHHAGQFLSV